MNSEKKTTGQWLKAQLDDRGWKQAELADAIGVLPGMVNNWVKGRRGISKRNCLAIAEALGLEPEEVLRAAGHDHGSTKGPLTGRQAIGEYTEQEIRNIVRSEVAGLGGLFAPIRIIGRVPADTTRWAEWEHEDRTLSIPVEWLGSRSPEQFFLLEVSGDCMAKRRIFDGAQILCRRLNGERPEHDKPVIVRIGNEYTLKVWSVEDGRTRLRDGDGNLIVELDNQDDVEVIGVVVRQMSEV